MRENEKILLLQDYKVNKHLFDKFGIDYEELLNKPDLSMVATSGDYEDLLNKPDFPDLSTLSTVATTGSYNDLIDKPVLAIATTTANGLMSSVDKTKLDGVKAGANKVANSTTNGNILIDNVETKVYTHPIGANPHGTTKSDVGLGNVDNTTDLNKPISTATQTALNDKISTSQKGVANGIAQLNSNGVVPSSQLPSYVDDVLEYASNALFPAIGESGKIYINTTTNITYRWTGSGYAEISPSIALGETSSTAYAGDKGKVTTDKVNGHTGNTSNPHSVTKAQVGLSNVPNVATNSQTPTYTVASADTALTSGEVLSTAFGKIAKAINSLISHIADKVSHITSTERTNWNNASTNNHTHSNKTTLDNTTASYTTTEKTKLSGIANNANNYSLPVASSTVGGVKSGTDITIDASGNVSVNDNSHNHTIANVDGLRTELDWVNNNTPNTSNGGSSKTSIVFPSANGVGVNFYNSQSYSIYMSKADDATYGGRLGETVSDYNMYFAMNGDSRGFVFKRGALSLAAIDAGGTLRTRGGAEFSGNVVCANDRGIRGMKIDGTSLNLIKRNIDDTVVVGTTNHSTFIHSYSTPTITLPTGSYRVYHEGNKPSLSDLGTTVEYSNQLSTVSTSRSVPPHLKKWTRLATLRITVQFQETNIQFNLMNNDASIDIITAIISARLKQQHAMGTDPYTGVVVNGVGLNANNFKAIVTTTSTATTLDLYIALEKEWRTFSMSKTLSANDLSALTPLQPFIDFPADAKFVPVIFK